MIALVNILLVAALQAAGPVITPLGRHDTTASGQSIEPPPVAIVSAFTTELAPGAVFPEHRHPYPRFTYVLAGQLRVENLDTGQVYELKAGDVFIEPRGQWHRGTVVGAETVRMFAVDQTPDGASNVERRQN
ncbi:MAG: cupin domain-containing protein [Caulobacteraceae bacterium]|nr:cupin domain-containing protein [Caulobacteraceae bacterium]